MYQLITYEIIGEDMEEVCCGWYRTYKEATYAALSTYKDVCPLILVSPNGDGQVIRE